MLNWKLFHYFSINIQFKQVKLYDDTVAFASTTSELKEFLDNNQAPDDSDVIIGLENFRRRNTVDKKVD